MKEQLLNKVENIVAEGEIVHHEHIKPQFFPKVFCFKGIKMCLHSSLC